MSSERKGRSARAWAMGLGLLLSASLPASAGLIPFISSATLPSGGGQIFDMALAGADLYAVGYASGGVNGNDILISRWNSASLTLVSSMTINGSGNGDDEATGLARDPASGNLYVVGFTSSTGQGSVTWLGKFDAALNVISTGTFAIANSTAAGSYPAGVVLAPNGSLYLVKPVNIGGATEIGVAKFDASWTFLSSATFYNGFNPDQPFRITADAASNLYVTAGVAPAALTSEDIWVGKFTSNLLFVTSSTLAGVGGGNDAALDAKVDPTNTYLFVTGYINNTGALYDVWWAKYNLNLVRLQTNSLSGPGPGSGAGWSLVVTPTRLYTTGNISASPTDRGVFLGELDYSLNILSTATFLSSGSSLDEAHSVAIDTVNLAIYSGGQVTPVATPTVWLGQFGLPPVPPTVAVVVPAAPYTHILNTLAGTAATGTSPLSQVQVRVLDVNAAQYWDPGALAFDAVGSESAWFTANGTLAWSTTTAIGFVNASTYTVIARSLDSSGHYSVPYSSFTTMYDTAPPLSFLASPVNGSVLTSFPTISGTASDSMPGSGVQVVSVQISSGPSYGTCWNGTSSWVSCPHSLGAVVANGIWSLSAGLLPSAGALTFGATYRVTSSAIDAATNVESPGQAAFFTYYGFGYTGSFPGGAVVASANGQNELGSEVAIDTITGGGPYIYTVVYSTSSASFTIPFVELLLQYNISGTVLNSAPLPGNTGDAHIALDNSGVVYVFDKAGNPAGNHITLTQYAHAGLAPGASITLDSTTIASVTGVAYDGTSVYTINDSFPAGAKVVKYNTSLVAVATATYTGGFSPNPLGNAIALDGAGGVYVEVSTNSTPGSEHHLVKYTSALAQVWDSTITALTPLTPGVAVSTDQTKVYTSGYNAAGNTIYVRAYNAATGGYTGNSSTTTGAANPLGLSLAPIKTAPSGDVYVAYTSAYDGTTFPGHGDYEVIKLDSNLNFELSHSFDGAAHSTDSAIGLAVFDSSDVIVTGASRNGGGDYDAVTVPMNLSGVAGGQVFAQATSLAPPTASTAAAGVPILQLALSAQGGAAALNSLSVGLAGNAPASNFGGVSLWEDTDAGGNPNNGDGSFEPGTDTFLSSASFSSSNPPLANLTFPSPTYANLTATTHYLFLTVTYSSMSVGRQFGLTIPSQGFIGLSQGFMANQPIYPIVSGLAVVNQSIFAYPPAQGAAVPTPNPSPTGGFDTGLTVQVGQPFLVTATGTWSTGSFGVTNATGVATTGGLGAALHLGSLVGRVGGGAWFQLGSSATVTAGQTGDLFLTMNDTYYADNSGQISVGVQVLGSTVTKVWTGASGANLNASVNANWLNGLPPLPGDAVVFDGSVSNQPCVWNIGNANVGLLTLTTSYTGTVTLAAGASQLTISSDAVVRGGAFVLGGSAAAGGPTLTVQGQLKILGGAFSMGSGGGILQLSKSGAVINNAGSFTSTGTAGTSFVQAINAVDGFPFQALWGSVAVNNPQRTKFQNTTGFVVGSSATVALSNMNFLNPNTASFPDIVFNAPNTLAPVGFSFSNLDFDVFTSTNIDASALPAGSTVAVSNATGPHMGSPFDRDPNRVVAWSPDGGSLGTISGTITNAGSGAGAFYIAYPAHLPPGAVGPVANFDPTRLTIAGSTGVTGAYSFSGLAAPNTYYFFAWRTPNANHFPTGFDPRGSYGHTPLEGFVSDPVFLGVGASSAGVNFTLNDWSILTGTVTNNSSQTGPVVVQAWIGAPAVLGSTFVANAVFPPLPAGGATNYALSVPAAGIQTIGFVDVNGDGFAEPFKARASSGSTAAVALTAVPNGSLPISGGGAAPGGVLTVSTAAAHPGYVGTAGPGGFALPQALLRIRLAPSVSTVTFSSLRVDLTGAVPVAGCKLALWRDAPGSGVFSDPGLGGAGPFDAKSAETFVPAGVSTGIILTLSDALPAGTTATYFVTLDLLGQQTTGPVSVTISSTSAIGLSQGSLAAQPGLYPFGSGPAAVLLGSLASQSAQAGGYGGEDAGVAVAAGQSFTLFSHGNWSPDAGALTTPDGRPGTFNENTLVSEAAFGQLLARIDNGNNGGTDWFPVTSDFANYADVTGEVFLAINDTPGAYFDNYGAIYSSFSVTGSTTGALEGTITYAGTVSLGSLVITAGTADNGLANVNIVSTISVPMSVFSGTTQYAYAFDALPPDSAYVVNAVVAASPTQSGTSGLPQDVVAGSTVTGTDFPIALGVGTLSGTLAYAGVQNSGQFYIGVTTVTDLTGQAYFFGTYTSTASGSFTIPNLPTPNTFYMVGFRDVNGDGFPDGPEPFGVVGVSTGAFFDLAGLFTPIFLDTSATQGGLTLTLLDHGAVSGSVTVSTAVQQNYDIVVQLGHGSPLSDSYQFEDEEFIFHNAALSSHPGAPQPYLGSLLRPATDYSVFAFVDVNNDGFYDPAVDPSGQVGGPLTVPQGGFTHADLSIAGGAVPPPAVSGFQGQAPTTTAVVWTWNLSPGATAYQLRGSTNGVVAALGPAATTYTDPLTPGATSAIVSITAANAFGTTGPAGSPVVASLPAVPGTVTSPAVFQSSAALAWSANLNGPSVTYQVSRSTSNGPFFLSITTTALTAVDAGLSPGTTYTYRIQAFNVNGAASAFSANTSTVTLPASGPSISGVAAYGGGQGPRIVLQTFTNAASTGVPAGQALLPAGAVQPYFLALAPNASYYLRAFVDVFGDLNFHNGEDHGQFQYSTAPPAAVFVANSPVAISTLALSVDVLPPASPYGLIYGTPGIGAVALSWLAPTTNADGTPLFDLAGFKVQRATVSTAGPFTTLAATTVPNYTDLAAPPGTPAYYRVVAVDFAGNQSSASGLIAAQASAGGTISGNLAYIGTTNTGPFRVRLSSTPAGPATAESTLNPFSFTGLVDGTYFVRAFRDLNGGGVQLDNDPAGTLGGIAQPYPINIFSGSANTGSTLTVCDRAAAAFGPPGSPQSYAVNISTSGCPAQDQGTGFYTGLLSFRAGNGAAGSVGIGTNIGIQMQSAFPNRLFLLGPDGSVQAQDSRSGGASINFTVNRPGLYLVEPTSFNPGDTGLSTVTLSVNGGFAGTISGVVTYGGTQNGSVVLQLFSNSAANSFPLVQTSTPNPGNFAITGLPDNVYYLRAFRDSNGNFSQDGGEAAGSYGVSATTLTAIQVRGGAVTNSASIVVSLTDPAVGFISGSIIREGSQTGTIRVEVSQPQANCTNCNAALIAFTTIPAAGGYTVPFIPPATNYILTSYVDVNGNGQADPLEAKGSISPVAVQASTSVATIVNLVVTDPGSGAAGNASIQGTISYGGASTGPLLMGFATDPQFQNIAYTLSQASTGTYYKSGVLGNTSYYIAAFLDSNNNGEPDDRFGEPIGFFGSVPSNDFNSKQPIFVGTGATAANIVLSDASTGSISGQVTYAGTQFAGKSLVVHAYLNGGNGRDQKVTIPAVSSGVAYNYTLPYLAASANYNVAAFIDVNGNGSQDFGEPSAFFGQTNCSPGVPCTGQPITVSTGPGTFPTYGISLIVYDPGHGNTAMNTGTINADAGYLGSQSGPIVFRVFTNTSYTGTPYTTVSVPFPPGPGDVSAAIPGLPFGTYAVDAFRDPSGTGIYNPVFDAYGVLQSVTLSPNQNFSGGGGGAQIVDPGQGGSVNVYSGSFTALGGARFDGGAVDVAATVSVDTITAGGPFLYVQGVTKQNAGIVSSLVKYSSAGVFMSSATLPTPDTTIARPALDGSGNIYLGQDIASAGSSSGTIVKYTPGLALSQTLIIGPNTQMRDLAYFNGNLYAVGGGNGGPNILFEYNTSLVAGPTGAFTFPAAAFGGCTGGCNNSAEGDALAVDSAGNVYVVARSQGGAFAGAAGYSSLLKFAPGLGNPVAQADISGLVPTSTHGNNNHLTLGTDSSGNVFVTILPPGDTSAHTYKFSPSLQQLAATSFGPLLSHFGGGVSNLVVSTDNYVYEGWETTAHGGDMLALRYDDNLNLVSSRTFDGLDNAHEDFAFGLAVQDSSDVFLTGGVTNGAGNLDWATVRVNMNASGAASGAGAVVVISTSNAVDAIFGSLSYGGPLVTSGTVRAVLLPLGSSTPIRLSSAPFAASVPYLFNNVPAGAYQIRAFDDLNNNLAPDAGEPVGFSSSTGFQFSGTSSTLLNVSLCDRRPIVLGVPLTGTLTPADCPAADRGGASQRLYTFAGTRGQAVSIEMDALNFYDTALDLYDPSGNLAAVGDDSGPGANAKIVNFQLPADGLYTIGASPYAAGLSSATFKLSLTGSAGSLGSLSGTVTYSGAQGGAVVVALFSSSSFNNSLVQSANIPGPGPFSFASLTTGSTYFLGAFIDVNGNGKPDAGEDVGLFGSTATGAAPIYLRSGQNISGVTFAIVPGFSASGSSGTFAEITGAVSYAGAQTGPLHVQFFSNSSFQGQPVSERVLPVFGPYDVPLPPNVPYYIRAYIDANGNNALDPTEPSGVYAPRGQGAEAVFALSSGTISGINIAVADPGAGLSGVAGDGLAALSPSTAPAGAQVFTATITYTAGASGVGVGGRIGFTVPQGFPAPQFVTVRSTSAGTTISAPTFSGLSAISTVTAGGLLAGQQVVFVYDLASVPCVLSTLTFSVSAAQNGLVPLTALFSGSPALQVLPGPVALLQPSNPYISLTQGLLSDPQSLEAHDACGNRTPLAAPLTATLRAKRFDVPTSSFLLDPSVGLSSAAAMSTSTIIGLNFAVGQSSAAYFAVSSSTGPKNLEVFYSLGVPTTFYYGMTALPSGALSNLGVSTVSFAIGASSASITPNGGANGLAYLNFTMADPTQPWHILISSIPLKPGVAPTGVWESWGQGQPLLGQIAWDGRFSPWINGGARVPSGFYFVRVELGGSGVHDDSLLINVNVPQLSGRFFDSGVTPNPPLSGVNVQIYGPNGTIETQSDALGNYVMPGIAAGTYNMFANASNFLNATLSVTVNAAGTVSTFTALSNSTGSINSSGGLDVLLTRASVLLVTPSLAVGVSTQAADLWGGLQVQSSTSALVPLTLSSPLHVAAGTTTFDDGGQWDPSVSTFVAHTQFRFNVAAGTYTVTGTLPGVSVSSVSVYVGPGVVALNLPSFNKKSSISGLVSLPAGGNPNGIFVSVNAVPLSSSTLVSGGFGGVQLAPGVLSGIYTVANLDAGVYLLNANVQAFTAVSTGPVAVPVSSDVAHVDFPAFTAGAAIGGVITVNGAANGTQLNVSAWAPGSLNFGSTNVYVAGGSAAYLVTGLSAGATYQVFANVNQNGGGNVNYFVPGGLPILTPAPQAALNFSFLPSSGVISGTILLPAGSTDFLDVSLGVVTLASAKPDDVGKTFSIATATGLPNFLCQPSNAAPTLGYCPVGNSSASFSVQGENTETLGLTFFYGTTGQTVKRQLSVVNGSTTPVVVDLTAPTFSISGAINNQITNSLFNTNPNIAANAPAIAPIGYPAGISATTARIEAILIPDITQFNTAISTTFNPATTRVGYLTAAGTYTVSGLPSGSYLVRTVDLRSCSTCSVLVPSVSQTINVAGVNLSSVNFTLSDGFTVAGTISLDGGMQDAQIFAVTVFNQRQEVVRSTNVALGDPNLGLTANAVNYSFSNLPANGFYTLTVSALPAPSKYAGSPIQFPNPALSPSGLQSNLSAQNVLLERSAMIVGRLKDANTGALIGAAQAGTLAPNFQISATANPWINGGFVLAASSVAARPIQADGYFRVGPLIPNVTYDLKLTQTNWDAAFLLLGSQNYSPVTVSGLTPQPGEVRDVGVVSLNQGSSLTGTVRQSTTTGTLLGGIEIDAVPSFNANGVTVQTFTNPQGRYTLWVSTYISNTFNITAAPRAGGNVSSGTVYGQATVNNVNLLETTTADFLLNPLLSGVTGQVVVEDAASGGLLSYPFGANKGFPAAAINLQPRGVVPTNDPLGDIEAVSDQLGNFSVPGLSTGAYTLKATSLGYSVFNATVAVSTGGYHIYTGADVPADVVAGNVLTLRRGATLTGRIVKSDGTAPNNQEVGGIAAANFASGEYVVGSVDIDKTAKTVNSYTISGFKTGVNYSVVILPADKTSDNSFPPEGANVSFAAVESTTTKNVTLTFLPSGLDCLATSKGLGNSQFQIKVDCTKPTRNQVASDSDLSSLLTVSTFTSLGVALAAPNGTGQLLGSDKSLSQDRREFTAIYRAAANETSFSLRVRAFASTVDPRTGSNFAIDKVFDFFTGLDSNVNKKINNMDGGSVNLEPSGNDEAMGLDERSSINLPPGAFAAGLDTDPPGSAVAGATVAVSVGLSKAKDQASASVLFLHSLGYVPSSVATLGNPSAFPAETWAAMSAFKTQNSTSTVGGANPLSSFYSIFLPAGIRHQLKQAADITFSYNTSLSTSTNPNNINVWFYNATLGKFVLENTNRRLDTNAKTITVAVNHFSVFVVLDGAPAIVAPGTIATSDILAFNFPNPSDCVVHSNVTRDTRVGFGAGSTFNPFQGTMIRYSLPPGSSDATTIRIYSLSGQLVRTIDQGSVSGNTTAYFPWACDNQSGKTVASGVYIGEVQWGNRHKYFKIAIVKGSGL